MSLDLEAIGRQLRAMTGVLLHDHDNRRERVLLALGRYLEDQASHTQWAEMVDLSQESAQWLLARPVEPLDTVVDLPPRPEAYAIVATDGSQIDVERHGPLPCYVINIGCVYLRYGAESQARLFSRPQLFYRDEDRFLTNGIKRVPIEGNYLSARRDVEEGAVLAELAAELLAGDLPQIAVQDGTLVRWALANAEQFVQDHFLSRYIAYLDRMEALGVPVASYISRPRAPEAAGLIRLMFCPDVDMAAGKGAVCSTCSDVAAGRPVSCMVCHDLSDAEILGDLLAEGQRGPLFVSMSRINVEAYGRHLIHFFYLRVGRELARIEIPRWVAEDRAQVDRVHALLYDQYERGQGYPVALQRAHEKAVVKATDRRTFLNMVENSLTRADLPVNSSRKRESKTRQAL